MAGLVGVLRQLGDLAEYVLGHPSMLLPPRPCYLGCSVFPFLQTFSSIVASSFLLG
jgi:hypothetical protein